MEKVSLQTKGRTRPIAKRNIQPAAAQQRTAMFITLIVDIREKLPSGTFYSPFISTAARELPCRDGSC
ncbi:hypothetical protein BJF91_18930 [Allorhizobium taibaishanense]|uniref:Uncharacterized protein n=1 Tax=Allorhizobium taibaishanense TaxID=887144 RepID=A0A1Q9A3Q0_9HYPH|nr:hypothetical protein BJF91_18930 [Allorhizobium taibaishanense]